MNRFPRLREAVQQEQKFPLAAVIAGFLGVLFCGGLLALALVILNLGSGGPIVAINSPPANASFSQGEEVMVQASAQGMGIVRLELWVDTALVDAALTPSPQNTFTANLSWEAAGIGPHTLQAVAINTGGQQTLSPEVAVQVVGQLAEATPSPTPLTLHTPTPIGTARPTSTSTVTPTATPTATPTPQPTISFTAEDTELLKGECTNLHWDVHNIKEVYLITNGGSPEGVVGEMQTRNVCPPVDTTYTLRVVKLDGSVVEEPIDINVESIHVVIDLAVLHIIDDSDSDEPFCVFDCAEGEIWLEFTSNGSSARFPDAGTQALNSGEELTCLPGDCPLFNLELGVNDDLHISVDGFDEDTFGTDSLGTAEFNFSAPPNTSWCGEHTATSTLADGQFEITIRITSPC